MVVTRKDATHLRVVNAERMPGEAVLNMFLRRLQESGCSIGVREELPTEDMFRCDYQGSSFRIYYDEDYSMISVATDSEDVSEQLIQLFE